jgi:tRNA threonylcarbamoyladenosine biosynthesis protein TsaE
METGRRIGRVLPAGSVVLLSGVLGAGKTTLVKGIAQGMGIREEISSPTYTIVSEYPAERPLHHIDLYRVEGADQIENLGLDDILWEDGISVIEWGEKLEGRLLEPPIRITLEVEGDDERTISVEGLEL